MRCPVLTCHCRRPLLLRAGHTCRQHIPPAGRRDWSRGCTPLEGGWGQLAAPWHCTEQCGGHAELMPVPLGTHQPHYHSPGAFTNINLKKLNFQRRDCHLPARFNEVSR